MDGFGVAMLAGAGLIVVSAAAIHRALRGRTDVTDEAVLLEPELEAA
jgi:hypothetical protein